jgi:hypothetical protein
MANLGKRIPEPADPRIMPCRKEIYEKEKAARVQPLALEVDVLDKANEQLCPGLVELV